LGDNINGFVETTRKYFHDLVRSYDRTNNHDPRVNCLLATC